MSDFVIIDRRSNPKAKNFGNRQRFLDRVRKQVRTAASKKLAEKSVKQDGRDTSVSVPTDNIREPRFRYDPDSGTYDVVAPGNDQYVPGDLIEKPPGGGGKGGGGEGSPDGEGEDEFQFLLSYEEFLNIVFDGLELPDMIKQADKQAVAWMNRRAGFTPTGVPTNLNIERTIMAGMARRIALRTPKYTEIEKLEEEMRGLAEDDPRRAEIVAEIEVLRRRALAVGFLDNVDLRYNNYVRQPRPITQAVMFCVLDVSASMGEREKIISKKFFILLYLFMKRKYQRIEVVFIRHHTTAMECDEQTFFTARESGGTVVSSAYEKMAEVVRDRYNLDDWNIYLAQASDGDNAHDDNARAVDLLKTRLLPVLQHMFYIQITQPERHSYALYTPSSLWSIFEPLSKVVPNMRCQQIADEDAVIGVFRELFSVK